jgi:methylase of polypeptide subunit release factors
MGESRTLSWQQQDQIISRLWRSEADFPTPKLVREADSSLKAEEFIRQASEGTAFVWTGPYQAARDLLALIQKRIEGKSSGKKPFATILENFHRHRQSQAHKARILSRLLIPIEKDGAIMLPKAPDVRLAVHEAFSDLEAPFVISLRELLGLIGAHEWRKKGVDIPALKGKIHPHYGVFAPIRGEYLELVATAPLPASAKMAFDIGTGTGVLAAILARRGVARVQATDCDSRALTCARENLANFGLDKQIELYLTKAGEEFFPPGTADVIVCNPPWLPGRPTSTLERAVYDPDSLMLRGFLFGVGKHLNENGEAWLIISDLGERLGLRSGEALLSWIRDAGLEVVERHSTQPRHAKTQDQSDPLHEARSQEITSLWRLKRRQGPLVK